MIAFSFHPEAEAELLDAVDYYESCSEGLGLDFSLEIYAAIQMIREHPDAWPLLEGNVRRCLARRFPYGVLYCVDGGAILILAVMHLHKAPGYWKPRA